MLPLEPAAWPQELPNSLRALQLLDLLPAAHPRRHYPHPKRLVAAVEFFAVVVVPVLVVFVWAASVVVALVVVAVVAARHLAAPVEWAAVALEVSAWAVAVSAAMAVDPAALARPAATVTSVVVASASVGLAALNSAVEVAVVARLVVPAEQLFAYLEVPS